MRFEVVKIRNGWEVSGIWIEPGGGGYEAMPLKETLYCKDIVTAANLQNVWATNGFDAAQQWLQETLNKEAKK